MADTEGNVDEQAYIDYAENFVMTMQKLARHMLHDQGKGDFVAVMETCTRLEDMAYHEALRDCSLSNTGSLWHHTTAYDTYQG